MDPNLWTPAHGPELENSLDPASLHGRARNIGDDAFDITFATDAAIKLFATSGAGGPPRSSSDLHSRPVSKFQKKLDVHVRQILEMLCTDAASNEVTSGRLMKQTLRDAMKPPLVTTPMCA